MRKNEKKFKRIITMLLSVAIIFTMSSYGNIGVYAEEDAAVSEEIATPNDASEDDTYNDEIIESENILSDRQTFAQWSEAAEAEIANADHIIGPNGDISTNNYTLVMPGETIGIRPDCSLSNKGIQGNITDFEFTVSQLDNPTIITTYLTNASSIAKAKAFTSVATRTVTVPYEDRTILDPPGDAVASHTGKDTFTYTSLYRNDTGLPVVLKGNWYNAPCTGNTVVYTTLEGKNQSDYVNFQGSIKYNTNPEIYFLESSYDLSMDEYCIYDSFTTGPITDVFWPGQIPTKIQITHGSQKLTFPRPVLKGHLYSKLILNSDLLNYFSDTKTEGENSIEITINVDSYLKSNNNINRISNTAKIHKVSPEFYPGYLTGEFHAQGGTINGFSSYQFEIVDTPIEIDINDYVPVRKGYDFKGWTKTPDNPVIITDTKPNVNHDWINTEYADNFHTDLYAVWGEKESFTVTFEANGATGIMDPVKVYAGDPFILPACGFTAPSEKTFDGWDKGAVGESITITGNITVTAKWKDNAKDEPETKTATKVQEFTADDITDDIKAAGYETVDAITKQLRLVSTEKGFDEKNSMLYEVKLQISTDGGATWVDATPDNFPANGLAVKFAYPEGTDSSYDFVIVHMFGTSMNGHTAGQTETFSGTQITKEADGLHITITGLSPFLISWKEAAKDAADTITTDTTTTDTTATTPATVTAKETTDTTKKTASSPKTSDETPIALTILLMLDSGLGALYLTLKKHS